MSGVIRMEVARKRAAATETKIREEREAKSAARAIASEHQFNALLQSQWEAFSASIDALLEAAKGEDGSIGPTPEHQWNREKTRIRFQRPGPDGEPVWGKWSADLRGESRTAVLTGVGGGGITEQRINEIIQSFLDEPELAADISVTYVSGTNKVESKVVDGIKTLYFYGNDGCEKYKATAPDGTALGSPTWSVVRSMFDAEFRPIRRQRLTNVPADDLDNLAWPV